MKKIKIYHNSFWSLILLFFINSCANIESKSSEHNEQSNDNLIGEVWSVEKANEWGKNLPWLRGANFNPSTAINQLEFWQEDTFDPETIDRELGWASDIGMNCMRVYLHHAAWKVDRDGFKRRINKYLTIASKHSISTIFVFFDDCWNYTFQSGKQPEPKPGVHNSGWIMDPGDLLFTTENLMPILKEYVTDILKTFKNNENIILWDLYNEPGNSGRKNTSLPLLKNVFKWARKVNPKQPLTVGVWNKDLEVLNKFQLENSDIISYHNYNNEIDHQNAIDSLNKFNRPMMCTEYMARRNNSLFSNIMPILKKQKIGAINWGLVTGKSNTKYAWDEPIPDGSEPGLWFHDIFYKNGVPYKNDEVELIKKLSLEK
jgi:hypothetical protein